MYSELNHTIGGLPKKGSEFFGTRKQTYIQQRTRVDVRNVEAVSDGGKGPPTEVSKALCA